MGDESLITNNNLAVTGLVGTTTVGNVTSISKAVVSVTNVSATGFVNVVNVWGLVDDSQTPNYSEVSTTQTPTYSEVSTTQSPDWSEVA